jgi:hypothetical protein
LTPISYESVAHTAGTHAEELAVEAYLAGDQPSDDGQIVVVQGIKKHDRRRLAGRGRDKQASEFLKPLGIPSKWTLGVDSMLLWAAMAQTLEFEQIHQLDGQTCLPGQMNTQIRFIHRSNRVPTHGMAIQTCGFNLTRSGKEIPENDMASERRKTDNQGR